MIFLLGIISNLLVLCTNGDTQRNSDALWNLLVEEHSAGRVIGSFGEFFPTRAKFFNGDLNINLDKDLLKDKNANVNKDISVLGGRGVEILPTNYPINIDISPPNTNENICGLIFANSNSNNQVKKIQILWKGKSQWPWDQLSVPSTGDNFFHFNNKYKTDKTVLLFDPVPTSTIRLLIHAKNGQGLNLSVTLIYGCQFPGAINLACSEIFKGNVKFAGRKRGTPKIVTCPSKCTNTKPCIGYKVYSTDSPICTVAQQALGDVSGGQFFVYDVPRVTLFRDQINPFLNNRIYCRRSKISGPGITFNRVYYDFTVEEYRAQKSNNGT